MRKLRTLVVSLALMLMPMMVAINAYSAAPCEIMFTASASARLVNGSTVQYTAVLPSLPASDDGMLYLYALQPYEYSVSKTDYLVGSAPLSLNPSFSFGLTGPAGSMICNKFALCVKSGGKNVMLANGQYITNPEVAASNTRAPQAVGFVEPYEKMCLYRIGEESVLQAKLGNYSTAVIVNRKDKDLINPYAKKGETHGLVNKRQYYALNGSTAVGVTKLAASMRELCLGSNIDEFIIGNEVNTRTWNYTAWMDWESYVREYAQAFRVAYNAIKSTNANATVYISLDQCWNRDRSADYYQYIDSADFLIFFNSIICAEGNIDWGLAAHPYLTPLTYAKFWDMSGCPNGSYFAEQITSGKMLSFQNLPLMTSFMVLPAMHSPKGGVRNIILPEIGITQAQGVEVQAAAMMACYQACRNNPYIKRIYFHRMNEGGSLNFSTTGISESVYQSLLRGDPGEYNSWALNYIGIGNWNQVVMY